jgi:cytidyltransferase-like protein
LKKYNLSFVSGNFFVLHPGHIRFLRFAAGIAERLVVGVRDTHPSSQYPTPSERVEALQALNLTGEIVGNPPLEPRGLEVEFFPKEEVLHEKVKIYG